MTTIRLIMVVINNNNNTNNEGNDYKMKIIIKSKIMHSVVK